MVSKIYKKKAIKTRKRIQKKMIKKEKVPKKILLTESEKNQIMLEKKIEQERNLKYLKEKQKIDTIKIDNNNNLTILTKKEKLQKQINDFITKFGIKNLQLKFFLPEIKNDLKSDSNILKMILSFYMKENQIGTDEAIKRISIELNK